MSALQQMQKISILHGLDRGVIYQCLHNFEGTFKADNNTGTGMRNHPVGQKGRVGSFLLGSTSEAICPVNTTITIITLGHDWRFMQQKSEAPQTHGRGR